MKRTTILALLTAVGVMAIRAARAGAALLAVGLTGTISSLAATMVANRLAWHGLETMPHQITGV